MSPVQRAGDARIPRDSKLLRETRTAADLNLSLLRVYLGFIGLIDSTCVARRETFCEARPRSLQLTTTRSARPFYVASLFFLILLALKAWRQSLASQFAGIVRRLCAKLYLALLCQLGLTHCIMCICNEQRSAPLLCDFLAHEGALLTNPLHSNISHKTIPNSQ